MKYICKINTGGKDRYFEWSTVSDAPITYGMSIEEFRRYYQRTYGEEGMQWLEKWMPNIEAGGCSFPGVTLDELIRSNRAGTNEKKLTKRQLIVKYRLA